MPDEALLYRMFGEIYEFKAASEAEALAHRLERRGLTVVQRHDIVRQLPVLGLQRWGGRRGSHRRDPGRGPRPQPGQVASRLLDRIVEPVKRDDQPPFTGREITHSLGSRLSTLFVASGARAGKP